MGETRVDLLHLLEDLRDAYPGSLEEVILTEIVANSLDSGATAVVLSADPAAATLTVVDDGRGMTRRELGRYHDLATTSKQRGSGIGFAGVGIKLGLLLCDDVVTETRRGKTHVATRWHLKSKHRAPWKWVDPPGRVVQHGTGVCLALNNALSPLLDDGFVEATLRRQYEPLFDPAFDAILQTAYPDGVRFAVNGHFLGRRPSVRERVAVAVKLPRKRKPSASGYLVRSGVPLSEEQRGVAVSTLGKVIKRGWDWLGVTPAAPEHIGGLIEVPALAESLMLNKADFIRTGKRGALYLVYRKALQEVVAAQLAEWGDVREAAAGKRQRRTRPIERDLRNLLADLADEFPLLAALVERRPGGQRRLPLGGGGPGAVPAPEDAAPVPVEPKGAETAEPEVERAAPETASETASRAPVEPKSTGLPGTGRRRPARYGLSIRFESRPDDPELGRLVESTVWVNDAHPAYQRAVASRSEGYHLALSVAMALAPLTVEGSRVHEFITTFLARWGDAARGKRRGRRG